MKAAGASTMGKKVAYLFPAFGMKYKDFSRQCLDGYGDEVAEFLAQASAVVELDMRKFERPGDFVLDDPFQNDLQEQYVCYVDSCAVGSLLKKRSIACDYVAGYSMGLFAALYHSSAVSFQDGLRLIHHTCTLAHEAVQDDKYGMGVVVGLTADELGALIAENCREVEVADVCGPRVVIASGRHRDLERLLEASVAEGSLHAKLLPVSIPFHASVLCRVEGRIREFLKRIEIRAPACGVVSCVNQKVLSSAEDVRQEAAANVWHPLNWFKTMSRLLELGVGVFVECGLSESLCNLARNLQGDYQIYHPRQFDRLFAALN
jgi:[acyl-carrier-protein] S-malonyltransferase